MGAVPVARRCAEVNLVAMTVPHPDPRVREFAQRVSATRRGARLARRLAGHQLHAWGIPYRSAASDAVCLVVAELAANAVLHGRVPGRCVALRLRWREGVVRVEVCDPHPAHPVRGTPGEDGERGRGLLLVEAIADRWGVAGRSGPGKTVWAELAVPGPHAPDEHPRTPGEPGARPVTSPTVGS
jgi:anti-sigma regulatory factor (Ser/Thr protein kinase)